MRYEKYEENELRLRKLEEMLNELQRADDRNHSAVKDDISKVQKALETARNNRQRIFESDYQEFLQMERKMKTSLEQSSRVS